LGGLKENCMCGTCSTHERDKLLQNVSKKPRKNKPFRRPRFRCKDNIKIVLKQ
jgi:hypothetical protein